MRDILHFKFAFFVLAVQGHERIYGGSEEAAAGVVAVEAGGAVET